VASTVTQHRIRSPRAQRAGLKTGSGGEHDVILALHRRQLRKCSRRMPRPEVKFDALSPGPARRSVCTSGA
jgi:hypothetical protein